jgi:hypothetical protein
MGLGGVVRGITVLDSFDCDVILHCAC